MAKTWQGDTKEPADTIPSVLYSEVIQHSTAGITPELNVFVEG